MSSSSFPLYDDALHTVFSFLCVTDLAATMCKVSKHWFSVAHSQVTFSSHGTTLIMGHGASSPTQFSQMFDNLLNSSFSSKVRKLVVENARHLSSGQLVQLSTHISRLDELMCDIELFDVEKCCFPLALTKLNVNVTSNHDSSFRDVGVHAMLTSAAACNNLTSLDLSFHCMALFNAEYVTSGLHALTRLTKLSNFKLRLLQYGSFCNLTDGQLRVISSMPSLTRLDLQDGDVVAFDLEVLAHNAALCQRLQYINVEHVWLTAETWTRLSRFKALTEIRLCPRTRSGFDIPVFDSLAAFTCLTYFDLNCSCPVNMDSLIVGLSQLKELKTLILADFEFGSEHLERVLPQLPHLSSLHVDPFPEITSLRFLTSSKQLPCSLTSLRLGTLSERRLPKDFFVVMQPLKSLTSLLIGFKHSRLTYSNHMIYPDHDFEANPQLPAHHTAFLRECNPSFQCMYASLMALNPHCI